MFASVGDEKEFSGLAVAYINGTGEIFASDWPGMIPEPICKQANNTATPQTTPHFILGIGTLLYEAV